MRRSRYALAADWAAGILALLFCLATDPSLFDDHIVSNVSIITAGTAIVGLALGWIVAPRE